MYPETQKEMVPIGVLNTRKIHTEGSSYGNILKSNAVILGINWDVGFVPSFQAASNGSWHSHSLTSYPLYAAGVSVLSQGQKIQRYGLWEILHVPVRI